MVSKDDENVDFPIIIKGKNPLITNQKRETFPNQDLVLIACNISGNTLKTEMFLQELKKLSLRPGEIKQRQLTLPSSGSGFYFVRKDTPILWRQVSID